MQIYRERGLLHPRQRQRGRHDDFAYQQSHVDRLRFIGRALNYGFSVDDVAQLLDPDALVTCNDVYRVASRKLEELRKHVAPTAPPVVALERLTATCQRAGARKDCQILAALSLPPAAGSRSLD